VIKYVAMKMYGGVEAYVYVFLILALDGGVVSFRLRLLYPRGKSPRCALSRRLGGPQSRSGRGGEEKNFVIPPGIELRSSSP